MDVRDAICERKSIRSFLKRKVAREVLESIIETAVNAPSAGNLQPWRFVVLNEPDLISRACALNINAYWGKRAPAAILVCSDENRHEGPFWPQSCATVTQNILLLAHEAGLGATWTGVYPIEERMKGLTDLLNLPRTLVPFALVVMGYPKQRGTPKVHSAEGKVYFNRFTPSTQYVFVQKEGIEESKVRRRR